MNQLASTGWPEAHHPRKFRPPAESSCDGGRRLAEQKPEAGREREDASPDRLGQVEIISSNLCTWKFFWKAFTAAFSKYVTIVTGSHDKPGVISATPRATFYYIFILSWQQIDARIGYRVLHAEWYLTLWMFLTIAKNKTLLKHEVSRSQCGTNSRSYCNSQKIHRDTVFTRQWVTPMIRVCKLPSRSKCPHTVETVHHL